MPKAGRVVTVLLACPTDVQAEAALVHRAAEEVNRGFGSLQAARLEVVDWQTHASPGIGSDAQDVINRQLPADYDIFLGVMWARFGTATPRAGSGTEEEFERALARYKASPNGVKILFYFKQAPLPPDAIDPEQLQKVNAFRERLVQEGVLFQKFESAENFERQLRQHLTQQLGASLAGTSVPDADNGLQESASTGGNQSEGDGEGDGGDAEELGFLDYVDRAEEQFGDSRVITERMAAAITEIGEKVRQRTEEMQSATADGKQPTRKEARAMFAAAAKDMDCFSEKLTEDLPRFRSTLVGGITATRQAAWLLPDGPEREVQLKKVIDDLSGLRDGLGPAIEAMHGFQGTVHGLPKMTKELNAAKKRTGMVLGDVLEAMKGGEHMVRETIALIESTVEAPTSQDEKEGTDADD